VTAELAGPNGLAFSPDEKKLYIVESRAQPNRLIWAYDVGADGFTLSNKTKFIDANGPGALDGFRVDTDGNLWCGWGSNGSPSAKPEELDGVRVFSPEGKAIWLHPPSGALCQSDVRRPQEEPPVHGKQPFPLRAVCRGERGGMTPLSLLAVTLR
jgi:hypothetical protein